MISFDKALDIVVTSAQKFEDVSVPLAKADGRILAEDISADRDFPPFNRATRDGIAVQINGDTPNKSYTIEGIAPAGTPQQELSDENHCLEIMTGAIVPKNANAVIMYEHLVIEEGRAVIKEKVITGQHIHLKGSDEKKGSLLLKSGTKLTAAEIGVLASVGKSTVVVKKNPRVTIFSTGDELVPVAQEPELHQIRQSNSHSLRAALLEKGITSKIIHIVDNADRIKKALTEAFQDSDVVLMSGGVSRGKFDHIPSVLEELGVIKRFHRVLQQPGKPFWFGSHEASSTTIFGFPGNPASTFANYHVYFLAWLRESFGLAHEEIQVVLDQKVKNTSDLTRFLRAKVTFSKGTWKAALIVENGSGDLTSLAQSNGFIKVNPYQELNVQELVTFIPTRNFGI